MSETTGEQQPPERPVSNDAIDAERAAASEPLSQIETAPGDRLAGPDKESLDRLVIEAELACDGVALDNPAKPMSEEVGQAFLERLDNHEDDLVPAWTRPWEEQHE